MFSRLDGGSAGATCADTTDAKLHTTVATSGRAVARGRAIDMMLKDGALALFHDELLKTMLAGDVSACCQLRVSMKTYQYYF